MDVALLGATANQLCLELYKIIIIIVLLLLLLLAYQHSMFYALLAAEPTPSKH